MEVTVVSNGKKVSKILSQNMDEKEIEKRMQQLQKLKIHPKDMTENRLMKERLQVLFEESLPETRERILSYIEYFDQILASQDPRRIDVIGNYWNRSLLPWKHMTLSKECWNSRSGRKKMKVKADRNR